MHQGEMESSRKLHPLRRTVYRSQIVVHSNDVIGERSRQL